MAGDAVLMSGLAGYPAGTRIIVRRERPHPGAQLSLFDQDQGLRHQVFLTDTPYSGGGSAQFLEVRHRGHATVEDHIRCGKTTGEVIERKFQWPEPTSYTASVSPSRTSRAPAWRLGASVEQGDTHLRRAARGHVHGETEQPGVARPVGPCDAVRRAVGARRRGSCSLDGRRRLGAHHPLLPGTSDTPPGQDDPNRNGGHDVPLHGERVSWCRPGGRRCRRAGLPASTSEPRCARPEPGPNREPGR